MKAKISVALIVGLAFGLVLGVLFTGAALNLAGDRIIIKEMRSPFDDFDKTVRTITNRIAQAEGWHVMEILDYDKIVTEEGQPSIGPMKLIKFCNSYYAARMLGMDDYKIVGAMLPKTIAVYEKSDGHVYVAIGNGHIMGKFFGGPAAEIVEKVSYEIEDIMRFMNFKFTLF